jgi:hypothetical protein
LEAQLLLDQLLERKPDGRYGRMCLSSINVPVSPADDGVEQVDIGRRVIGTRGLCRRKHDRAA